jgi:hypothetical protein
MSPMVIIYGDGLNFIKEKEKKMEEKSRLLDFLKGKNNRYSYKRLTGFGAFVVAAVLAFSGYDDATVGMFLGLATVSSGTTVFEKKDEVKMPNGE